MTNKFYGGYICNSGTGWVDVDDGKGNVETITHADLDFGDTFDDFCRKYGIAEDYIEYLEGEYDV